MMVYDKCHELAQAIKESKEYKEYKEIKNYVYGELNLKDKVEEFEKYCDVITCTDDSRDACRCEAVFEVVGNQLVAGRNGNGAHLMQSGHYKPELIVALEHQHDLVALLNAKGA